MKIKLANGAELYPILVTGGPKHVQGMSRDTLTFVFPEGVSLDEADRLFSEANCETLSLYEETELMQEDGSTVTGEIEHVHKGYTIRAELARKPVETKPATTDTAAAYENRVTVSMAQRNYSETQVANLTETVDALVLESLMS